MAGSAHFSTSRVEGLGDLIAGLKKESVLATARAESAIAKTAERIAASAREAAPVGETGDLRDSIEVTARGLVREVGPTVRYGGFVEFGTWKDEPQPYLFPAAEKHEPELEQELERLVGDL